MSHACQYLHDTLSRLPRLRHADIERVANNGIYVLFENGEEGHCTQRIVRIGTHRGQNNLALRMREHLYAANKDRSIFRKHVGRCLLAKAGDTFLSQWEIDLTTIASRKVNEGKVDKLRLREVEADVTRYMVENFSFAILCVATKEDRLVFEERLLSTIRHCSECGPSDHWLGSYHPTSAAIRNSGLWNVQGLAGTPFTGEEAEKFIEVAGRSL
jgi:hypothetical protein